MNRKKPYKICHIFVISLGWVGFAASGTVIGDPATLPSRLVEYSLHSGELDNLTTQDAVVFDHVVAMGPEVSWVRLKFESVKLSRGSVLVVTSLLDGASQTLDARAIMAWQNGTAYFNGSSVRVQLFAAPHSEGNSIGLSHLLVGDAQASAGPIDKVGICGGRECTAPPAAAGNACDIDTDCDSAPGAGDGKCEWADDRLPSFDPAVGRLLVDGQGSSWVCTGFIADTPPGPDKCHLSAGHCFDGWLFAVLQFNVPDSGPTPANPGTLGCGLNHPPPEDQFVVSKVEWEDSDKGHDWAVFRCLTNNDTPPQTTFGRQGAALPLGPVAPPPPGTLIRIPGYGADGGQPNPCDDCVAADPDQHRNHTQQDDIGPILTDTTQPGSIAVLVDVCGGDSGGPMIDAITGDVIGILTWGKCKDADYGYNSGTPITHPNLQAAITNCKNDDNSDIDPPNAPAWWRSSDCGDYWAFGKWAKPPASYPAYPDDYFLVSETGWLTPEDFQIVVKGRDVVLTMHNGKLPDYVKNVYIYLSGTSTDGGVPTIPAIRGDNSDSGQSDSAWSGKTDAAGDINGWYVMAEGRLTPQPDMVVFTFTMPLGGVITHAWAGECCSEVPTDPTDVPAMPKWALAVLTLLLFLGGTIVFRRVRTVTT